jgi:hypothetical protein
MKLNLNFLKIFNIKLFLVFFKRVTLKNQREKNFSVEKPKIAQKFY